MYEPLKNLMIHLSVSSDDSSTDVIVITDDD